MQTFHAADHLFITLTVSVAIYGLFTPPARRDKTVLSRLDPVLMSPRWRCEHNYWRRDKTVLSCRAGGANTTADKTIQFCLVRVGGVNKPLL